MAGNKRSGHLLHADDVHRPALRLRDAIEGDHANEARHKNLLRACSCCVLLQLLQLSAFPHQQTVCRWQVVQLRCLDCLVASPAQGTQMLTVMVMLVHYLANAAWLAGRQRLARSLLADLVQCWWQSSAGVM